MHFSRSVGLTALGAAGYRLHAREACFSFPLRVNLKRTSYIPYSRMALLKVALDVD